MKILVTGAERYIGSAFCPFLRERGHEVAGLDTGFYNDGWLYDPPPGPVPVMRMDVRRVVEANLRGFVAGDPHNVVEFYEKPEMSEGWINGGYFVLNAKVMAYIRGDETAWEREPVERLARERQLVGYRHPGFWSCMDTLKGKTYLEELWNSGAAPWKVWE